MLATSGQLATAGLKHPPDTAPVPKVPATITEVQLDVGGSYVGGGLVGGGLAAILSATNLSVAAMGMRGAKVSRDDSLLIRAWSSDSKLPCDKSASKINACAIFSKAFCTSSYVSIG